MKRGRAEPETDDIAICIATGWTLTELLDQPAEFVERLRVYLGAIADQQSRDAQRAWEEFEARMRRFRL